MSVHQCAVRGMHAIQLYGAPLALTVHVEGHIPFA